MSSAGIAAAMPAGSNKTKEARAVNGKTGSFAE